MGKFFLTMQARAGIPGTVWALGFVSLLMDISSEMVSTLLPLYLVGGLGASVIAVGLIEGLSVAIATATRFLSGVLADWTGRSKPLAVLGYGLGAASRLIFPLAGSVDLIVLGKAVERVGKGIRSAPRDVLIAGVTPPQMRGAAFGLRKSLDTVGGFVGPLIAVALMFLLAGDILSVFWIATVPAVMAVLVLMLAVREPAPAPRKADTPFRIGDALRLNRAVWGVIAIAAVLMLARFSEAFVLLKALEAGFTPAWVPLSMVIMHAVYGLAAYPVGRVSDRIGVRGLLILSLIFLIGAHLVLAFAGSIPAYLLGTVLWGLHMGFSQGLLGAMIAGATPEALKGTAFGTFNLVTGAVVLIGNTAAGWLWHSYGAHMPFLIGAGLSVLAILLLMRPTALSRP
ncbi:MFS transporter [Paracoccus laeviglucosivorans]|uniref:Predicted arabinose efflux permease, MFS family n=1 Tax=Paracoccus laeviglucosivorans TaxID=1197861 RepID=A0A521CZX9_9RHOB|nr:MFS transporter [Paracoccus laeviglucosivorans]SMO64210.1 Predicted arabinose efflux permease, MFS family [Paracoccus laeviglucosivorans]